MWKGATGGEVESSPAVAGGDVYVGSDDGKLYAFPAGGCGASTCSPLWTATTGREVDSSPTVAGGDVYVGSLDGKLYAFNASNGALRVDQRVTAVRSSSSPAVAGDVVYVGGNDDKLYAFDALGCGGSPCGPRWRGHRGRGDVVAGGGRRGRVCRL